MRLLFILILSVLSLNGCQGKEINEGYREEVKSEYAQKFCPEGYQRTNLNFCFKHDSGVKVRKRINIIGQLLSGSSYGGVRVSVLMEQEGKIVCIVDDYISNFQANTATPFEVTCLDKSISYIDSYSVRISDTF